MNKILFVLLSLLTSLQSYSQEQNEKEVSFLLLGDIHYDLLEDHDMEWLSTKPDDLRQVTKEYSVFTKPFCKWGTCQKDWPVLHKKQYRWLTVPLKLSTK